MEVLFLAWFGGVVVVVVVKKTIAMVRVCGREIKRFVCVRCAERGRGRRRNKTKIMYKPKSEQTKSNELTRSMESMRRI